MTVAEYTISSIVHGAFSTIDHILGQKSTLDKFKKIEIVSNTFSNHTLRLDINYRKNTVKNTNSYRLNNRLLNSQWITDEIKEIRKPRNK